MKKSLQTLVCATALISLSGCQGFLGSIGLAKRSDAPVNVRDAFGQTELAAARAALKDGRVAAAIKQFRLAAINSETRGDAFNGLGVSYAKLGRGDLAERYFQEALMEAPESLRYLANLERFYGSELGKTHVARREAQALLASAQAKQQATQVTVAPAPTKASQRGATFVNTSVRAPKPSVSDSGFLTDPAPRRMARNELFVSSRPQAEMQRRVGPVTVATRTRVKAATYPARVALPTVASRNVKAKTTTYPVRVELDEAKTETR
ncbi:hypothetical protein [Altererythrobacter sp. ZODW24]|uniref:tetratricopeptide repeat protein n=1 Tax=Altererythrobacter sp. ZODW24 TaxID=2185142 RepID=UPI000DF80D5C|nr:hypothetical protein [Altererythrobacter sp. ZODW24]